MEYDQVNKEVEKSMEDFQSNNEQLKLKGDESKRFQHELINRKINMPRRMDFYKY